jgi:hypothetical protein
VDFPDSRGSSVSKTLNIAATCALAFTLSGNCLARDAAARLPMWEEPSHQPVFSRGHVRVMDVFFPGGGFSYHPAGTTLTVANESQDPASFVLIEVKE